MIRLTPTQRAAVMIRLAYEAGRGGPPVSRADLIDRMFPTPDPPPDIPATGINIRQADEGGGSDPAPAPPPDLPADSRTRPGDVEITFAAAAERLGVTVATVKRYARPSSGRLVRMGDGVSSASVEDLAA
ncbi:hypothetical protein FraQA3DRAFT_0229 [Frankia sp. QA3]|nr:hypothetical protein FraQA3DRAFT_0229 [Frankia sp. QA3]